MLSWNGGSSSRRGLVGEGPQDAAPARTRTVQTLFGTVTVVTGNGISKLVFTILSAVAEAERDRTRGRIAEVKADQRRRGRFLGGPVPFGWRREGDELVAVPEQQAAIARMQKLRAEGPSPRAVRDQLVTRACSSRTWP